MTQFFLTYDEDLGKRPIDALKGGDPKELEMVEIFSSSLTGRLLDDSIARDLPHQSVQDTHKTR